MEICMAALLLSAFLYLNALSLVFLICIGAGMAAPEAARRRVWAMVGMADQLCCCRFGKNV